MPLVIPIALAGEDGRTAVVILKIIAIIVSVYTIGLVAWDLSFYERRRSRKGAGIQVGILSNPTPSPLEPGTAKRDISRTRLLVLLAAISTTMRSGAHLAFNFMPYTESILVGVDGTRGITVDVQLLRSNIRLDLAYYWFGFASFVFGLGTLARLNRLFLIGYLPKKTLIRRPRYAAFLIWLGPLVFLWLALCIALTSEFARFPTNLSTNPSDYTDEVKRYIYATTMNRQAIFILFLLLCGWIALLLTVITTDMIRRLVHASRAGILVGPERKALARHAVVLLVYLGLNGVAFVSYILAKAVFFDSRPFTPQRTSWEIVLSTTRFWLPFLVEVIGLPLMLCWAEHVSRVLAANSEKMMGVAWD